MDDEKFQKLIRSIKKIYTPEILKRTLINASLILTLYELMKYSLVQQVKNFFEIDGKEPSDEYKNEIDQLRNDLSKKYRKHDLLVYACWFKKHEVLTEEDLENVIKIWKYRNKIAHELINFIVDSDIEVDVKYLFWIRDIIEKADIWWTKEFMIPINSDFDQVEVKGTDNRSGKMLILDILLSIALELSPDIEKDKSGLIH